MINKPCLALALAIARVQRMQQRADSVFDQIVPFTAEYVNERVLHELRSIK